MTSLENQYANKPTPETSCWCLIYSSLYLTAKVINEAGIKLRPIENIKAATIPSTVLSKFSNCLVFKKGLTK
jgi:hypothetical protein